MSANNQSTTLTKEQMEEIAKELCFLSGVMLVYGKRLNQSVQSMIQELGKELDAISVTTDQDEVLGAVIQDEAQKSIERVRKVLAEVESNDA